MLLLRSLLSCNCLKGEVDEKLSYTNRCVALRTSKETDYNGTYKLVINSKCDSEVLEKSLFS